MGQPPQSSPDITLEDFVKLGVDRERVPLILATISRAEQSPTGSPPLSPEDAKELVEILDKAVSSGGFSRDLKDGYLRILRQVCHFHNVLPTSYTALGVISVEERAFALGIFADIYKGQLEAGNPVRIKVFRTQNPSNMENIKCRLYREIVGWKYVSHPNVLPFLGISEKPPPFCIVSSWMPNGTIVEYTQQNPSVNRLRLLEQSACGLQYLHSSNIVHSSINPGNILITEEGVARLADFGISGIITDPLIVSPGSTTTSKPGFVRYMAPEQMKPSKFNRTDSNPSKESDVHSLAMTAYEVLTGIQPYTGNKRGGKIIRLVVDGDRPSHPGAACPWLTDSAWQTMKSCWSEDPLSRLSISQVYYAFSLSARDVVSTITDGGSGSTAVSSFPTSLVELPPEGENSRQAAQPQSEEKDPQQIPQEPPKETIPSDALSTENGPRSLAPPPPPDEVSPPRVAPPEPEAEIPRTKRRWFKQAWDKIRHLMRRAQCW